MARPKLRSPDQPFLVRFSLGVYEFAASLQLAVVLIFLLAFVLAAATFVESQFGTRAVQFCVYGTWWFSALCSLLAVNIFCAASIRFPWKRHQTGFVITHVGLLTLLFGCLLSRLGGIDAQMPILEGAANSRAIEDRSLIHLTVYELSSGFSAESAATDGGDLAHKVPATANESHSVARRFADGPFAWQEYGNLPFHLQFMGWAHRDQGVLFDQDGIRLEVLDYYANSRELPTPYLRLMLRNPRRKQMNEEGREEFAPESWTPVELAVRESRSSRRPFGTSDSMNVGGGRISFWLAGSKEEQQSFLDSKTDGPVGTSGQVVLHVRGARHVLRLDEIPVGTRVPVDGGIEVEVVKVLRSATLAPGTDAADLQLIENAAEGQPAQMPAVELAVHTAEGNSGRLVLLADLPELNLFDRDGAAYGTYWFDHGQKSAEELMRGQGGSRIDVIQGPDQRLYYRYWNRKEVAHSRPLPHLAEEKVPAFKMPIDELVMYVDQFEPSLVPTSKVMPIEFNKDDTAVDVTRAARMKLTVDGTSDEFWLTSYPPAFVQRDLARSEERVVYGKGRAVAVRMPLEEVDVGFLVRLDDFERKLDPGTSQPSHYTSFVTFLNSTDNRVLQKDVVITMNAPRDFSDPKRKRSYRLFQESFTGPHQPGDPIFEQFYREHPDLEPKEQLYSSTLTVNYDPGRGIKYLGCFLIVAGIATMFYMRAYFFKPKVRPAGRSEPARRELVEARVA
jgi:hypothetical protein